VINPRLVLPGTICSLPSISRSPAPYLGLKLLLLDLIPRRSCASAIVVLLRRSSRHRLRFIANPLTSVITGHIRSTTEHIMLSQRLARAASAAAPRSAARAFTTTASQKSSTPSIGDINPEAQSVESFNTKQKQFREQLVKAQKQREASVFARSSSSTSSPSHPSFLPGLAQGLGSLSTSAGRAAEAAENEPHRKAGPLTNLIYGTKEGREMDAQIEASFSAVLARGKYVHSIVFHEVKPDKVDEYVQLVGEWYPKMAAAAENKVHLVGSWRTEVGDCDTFGQYS
jgi:hypothetical protein